MSDDQPLTARERIEAVQEAERAEALAERYGGFSAQLLRRVAKTLRWLAQDHRDYDRDAY